MKKTLLFLFIVFIISNTFSQESSTLKNGDMCPDEPYLIDVDSNIYNTVWIEGRCWMRENLRVKHYQNGDSSYNYYSGFSKSTKFLHYIIGSDDSLNVQYDRLTALKGNRGGTWSEFVEGICPTGWHIPSTSEYWSLIKYYKNNFPVNCIKGKKGKIKVVKSAAKALASQEGWSACESCGTPGYDSENNNISKFSAIPYSYNKISASAFNYWKWSPGQIAAFWSSSVPYRDGAVWDEGEVIVISHFSNEVYISQMKFSTDITASVRCVRLSTFH